MFDLGWSELLLVAVLAIIFVGPKDLPKLMRTAGQYVAKMRAMAREFQNSFEDLARETELEELRKQIADLRDETMKPLDDMKAAMNSATSEPPVVQEAVAEIAETGPTPKLPEPSTPDTNAAHDAKDDGRQT
jgi:sec-independent protein translocase protein TatB